VESGEKNESVRPEHNNAEHFSEAYIFIEYTHARTFHAQNYIPSKRRRFNFKQVARYLVLSSLLHRYFNLFPFLLLFYIYIVIIKNYNIQERILLNTITTINERIAYIHSY